jgi:D-alanyl-D-alanine carboxypeptidase
MRIFALSILAAFAFPPVSFAADRATLAATIQKMADDYVATRGEAEHISGVSISLSLPGGADTIDVASGRMSRAADAPPMTSDTLFQIGSITKSITAATLLQLQTEGALDLDDPLGKYLPEYPAWERVTLRRLLNMTSGIPTYDVAPAMVADNRTHGERRHYSPATLVGFVDPAYPGAPAATTGYDYSNANYILAGMVISKVTGNGLPEEFARRFFGPRYGLTDMHYVDGVPPEAVLARMPAGYNWQPGDPTLTDYLGKDFRAQDMSWAGAAGAAIATPSQVARWARTLYQSDALTAEARDELLDVVSMKSGAVIGKPSADDPTGFGLGVMGFVAPELGSGWEYEGGSMGFRMVYIFLPERDTVVALGLNSNVDADQDHIGKLGAAILQEAAKLDGP